MGLFQQMWRVRRSNALFRQMPADAQIGWILSFFDGLMPCPRVARCLLLDLNALSQFLVARFKFAPRPCNVFFHGGKFGVSSVQLFLRYTDRVGATQTRPHEFG